MCSRFLVTVPAVLVSLTDVAKMEQRKSVEDLKDLESFEKKILKEGEKRTREEAKNYLRLLTIGAESIWAWWHPYDQRISDDTPQKRFRGRRHHVPVWDRVAFWYGYKFG